MADDKATCNVVLSKDDERRTGARLRSRKHRLKLREKCKTDEVFAEQEREKRRAAWNKWYRKYLNRSAADSEIAEKLKRQNEKKNELRKDQIEFMREKGQLL